MTNSYDYWDKKYKEAFVMNKRILSMLLALVMILSMLPVQALAEEAGTEATTVTTEPVVTESATTESAATEPVVTESAATESAATEPVVTESAATEPAQTVPADDPVAAESVAISQADALTELAVGEQLQLTAAVLPEDTADKTVTWASSDDAIAAVEETGLVTGVAAGSVTITATCGDVAGTYELTVVAQEAAALTVGEQPITVATAGIPALKPDLVLEVTGGKSLQLRVYDASGADTVYLWKFEDEDSDLYATLTPNGLLTAKSSITEARTVTVRAYAKNDESVYDTFDVSLIPCASIVKLERNGQVYANQTLTVNVNDPADASVTIDARILPNAASQDVCWQVTDSDSLCTKQETVNDITLYHRNLTGTMTVTAVAADGSGKSAKLTVRFARLATKVEIQNLLPVDDSGDPYLLGGASRTLTTNVAADKTLTDRDILWEIDGGTWNGTVSSCGFASIDQNGKLTTNVVDSMQTVTVKATLKADPSVGDSVDIRVYPAVKTVTITPNPLEPQQIGQTVTLTAVVEPSDAISQVKWTCSNEKLATFDDSTRPDPTLNLLGAGKVRITCEAMDGSGKKASVYLVIEAPVNEVLIDQPDKTELVTGERLTLEATAWTDSSAFLKAANQKILWSVTDENGEKTDAATINGSGRLTAKSVKFNTNVLVRAASAEDKEIYDEQVITIKPSDTRTFLLQANDEVVDGMRFLEDTEMMNAKEGMDIVGVWYNSDIDDVEKADDCTFYSSSPKVATVTKDGHVETLTSGTTTITARCVDTVTGRLHTAKFTLKVTKLVRELCITQPKSTSLRSGSSLSLKATAWTSWAENIKASNQKVTWNAYEYDKGKLVKTDAVSVSSSGKVTAKNVTENVEVYVYATSVENQNAFDYIVLTIRPKLAYQMKILYDGEEVTGILNLDKVDDNPDLLTVEAFVSAENPVIGTDGQTENITGDITWTSSNKKVLNVVNGTDLYIVGTGKATLTAKLSTVVDGKKASFSTKITVNVVNMVKNLEIGQVVPGQYLFAGKSVSLRAVTNQEATNKRVRWYVEDDTYATVNAYSGVVTAKKAVAGATYPQSVTVYAKALDGSGVEDSITLDIYLPVGSIQMDSSDKGYYDDATNTAEMTYNRDTPETDTYSATVLDIAGDAYASDMKILKWSSSRTSVAKIDAETGEVTAVGRGTTVIKATATDGSNKYVSFVLTVK